MTAIRRELGATEGKYLFVKALQRDRERTTVEDWKSSWLWADMLAARGLRTEMSFYNYIGPDHLARYFDWLKDFPFPDYFAQETVNTLRELSFDRDKKCANRLRVAIADASISAVARYNAQDWLFQHLYPVPDRQRIEVALDFGAGHGRMANLALADGPGRLRQYIAVDGVSGSYLTQRCYFSAIEDSFVDYIDDGEDDVIASLKRRTSSIVHIPTWRLDLIDDASVDMACCVQVLRELPRKLVQLAIRELARVLKPGGALYIRDHINFHNPNLAPVDTILLAAGFVLEFNPHVRDQRDIHGIPRIWRKLDDVSLLLATD